MRQVHFQQKSLYLRRISVVLKKSLSYAESLCSSDTAVIKETANLPMVHMNWKRMTESTPSTKQKSVEHSSTKVTVVLEIDVTLSTNVKIQFILIPIGQLFSSPIERYFTTKGLILKLSICFNDIHKIIVIKKK